MISTAVTRQGPQHNITITIHSRRSVTRTSRRKLELLPSLPIRNAARTGYEHFMPSNTIAQGLSVRRRIQAETETAFADSMLEA